MNTFYAILFAFFGAGILRLQLGIVDGDQQRGSSLEELTESRSKKLKSLNAILDDPQGKHDSDDSSSEKRWKKGDATGDLTADQLKEHDVLANEIRALDSRIRRARDAEDRNAEQKELERRSLLRGTPRIVGDPANRGLSEGEQRDVSQFTLARACRGLVARINGKGDLDGVELEMAQEGESEARASGIEVKDGGIMISRMALSEQRDLTVTGGTGGNQGGMTVQTNKGNLLDSLFDSLNVRSLGATVYDGLVGNLDITRMVDGTAPAGKSENAQSEEYAPTMADLNLSPNRLPTFVDVSKQLFIQSAERSLQSFLERHIVSKLSVVMERAFINGTGTNEAEGILQTSGIGAVLGGTNGLAAAWSHIVKLVEEVDVDNALVGNLAYYTNPKVVSKLKRTPLAVDGSGDALDSMFILPQSDGGKLNDYNYRRSNAVPSNLTKGTADAVASAIIFGNWIDYVIAQWAGIELLADPFTQAGLGKNRIHAAVYYDGGVQRPASFAAMQDALTD